MNKYILALFTIVFTLNASIADIEVVDSFNNEDLEVVNIVPANNTITQSSSNVTETEYQPVLEKTEDKDKIIKKDFNKNSSIVNKKNAKDKKEFHHKKVQVIKTRKHLAKNAPELAIIIDDVSNRGQLRAIQQLPYHITPSIFPPTRMNMHSNNLAKGLKHFMVHLPLESHSRAMNKMYKMLFLKDSNKKIRDRVKEIRRLFPTAKYINNHTGSVFCQNYAKSKVLYKAIRKEGFIFLDSRTSQRTKFKRIARELRNKYYKSDIFIDNTQSIEATLKQIKKGIALAKRRGYAVMIGHPHPTTLKALRKATPLFRNIKMVYIDELKF